MLVYFFQCLKIEEKAMQEYFDPLVQKEKMEEKMKSIKEMKCRAVTCKNVSQQVLLSCKESIIYYTFPPCCVTRHGQLQTKRLSNKPCGGFQQKRVFGLASLVTNWC